MSNAHHFFVPEQADVNAQRNAAIRAGERELVVLHLHGYEEEWDGCRFRNPDNIYPPSSHETYGEDVTP